MKFVKHAYVVFEFDGVKLSLALRAPLPLNRVSVVPTVGV